MIPLQSHRTASTTYVQDSDDEEAVNEIVEVVEGDGTNEASQDTDLVDIPPAGESVKKKRVVKKKTTGEN